MERAETKIVLYRKCDFCGREEEFVGERQVHGNSRMVHFSICHSGIGGAATMDICDACQMTVDWEDLYKKSIEVFKAMQEPKQPHNADVEEWRR